MSEQAEIGEWPISGLPKHWAWVDFKTAFTDATHSKKKIKQRDYLEKGNLAVVDQGDQFIGGFTNDLALKNDATLPCLIFGDHTRAVKFVDFEFAQGADGVKVLQPNELFDPPFAYHALRCVHLPNKGYSRHFKFLRSTIFPIPPLPEQRRIVAKLDRLSARSTAARDHLALVTNLATRARQAILIDSLSGDWEHQALGSIASVGTGATPKKGNPRYYDGGTIPWITSGAVNDFIVSSAEQCITEKAIVETNCKVYPAGTLLMAMYGEGKTRGKVARLGIDAATNQALAAIQINSDARIRESWVIWLLRSQYLQLRELAAGGVQPNLNLGMVKRIMVPVPSVEEQDLLIAKIEAAFVRIDRLTEEATRAAHLLNRLDDRLLAKAFCGELVPQDPNDEPAEALLARLRKARAAAPRPKPHRRRRMLSQAS